MLDLRPVLKRILQELGCTPPSPRISTRKMKELRFEESTAGSTSQRAVGGQGQTSLQRHASGLTNFTEHLTGWEMGKLKRPDFIPLTTSVNSIHSHTSSLGISFPACNMLREGVGLVTSKVPFRSEPIKRVEAIIMGWCMEVFMHTYKHRHVCTGYATIKCYFQPHILPNPALPLPRDDVSPVLSQV